MMHYRVHTSATAPEGSRSALSAFEAAFGFVPNVAGAMATSPVLIGSLVELFGKVHGAASPKPRSRCFS